MSNIKLIRYTNAVAIEATWLDEKGEQIKCRAYDGSQMSELRVDLGVDIAAEYETMITQCEADYVHTTKPTLAALAAAKNAEINAARGAANLSKFPHAGKEFSCDALSRSDIDGVNGAVALTGSLPVTFPGAWKAVDNTLLPIADVSAWTAFYMAMVNTGTENFLHAQQLKTQLAAATTAEEIAAIEW